MKKTKSAAISLLLALAMLLVSSCSTIEAVELSAEYERTATETGSVSEDFITKLTALSFKMFSEITTEDEDKANLLFSPLSAAVCIAMITNGADGETLAELEELFGMDIETLNKSIYAYVASLYTSDDCKLSLSNSIWVRNTRITVKETFLQTNADWYGADAYSAPFDDSTVDDINKWCRDNTDGLINKIIDEIPQDAVAYLINSLLFDAKWMSEYDDDDMIENATFTNYDGTTSEVTLMDSIESQYLTNGNATGVMKYYSGYS
ncbi:MAG: serine protease, partial [Firmicutes bacterium]|nr:serine protease [Bacillota bacterium]